MVSVEVNDPDSWPFIDHHDFVAGDDVLRALIEENRAPARRADCSRRWAALSPGRAQGLLRPAFLLALVHDVNLVHGLLDAMGLATGRVAGAAIFADGVGAQALIRLAPGIALWSIFHLAVPKLADYREKVTLFFDDRIYELRFPSPYLNHQPTD